VKFFAAANDVAPIYVAASAMVGKQLSHIRRRGSPNRASTYYQRRHHNGKPSQPGQPQPPQQLLQHLGNLAIDDSSVPMIPVCACRR
jgi:hypothetical protein